MGLYSTPLTNSLSFINLTSFPMSFSFLKTEYNGLRLSMIELGQRVSWFLECLSSHTPLFVPSHDRCIYEILPLSALLLCRVFSPFYVLYPVLYLWLPLRKNLEFLLEMSLSYRNNLLRYPRLHPLHLHQKHQILSHRPTFQVQYFTVYLIKAFSLCFHLFLSIL